MTCIRSSASWISWPLAFLFAGNSDEGPSNHMPIRYIHLVNSNVRISLFVFVLIRFRHLDTTVRLATNSRRSSGANGGGGSTPSPENEFDLQSLQRSPRRSPLPTIPKKEVANSKM